MEGDLLCSKGYNIIIKVLHLNQLAKLVYEVQGTFMLFLRIQTKNQTRYMLGILRCKIYDEPKEHQKNLNIELQNFSSK